MEFKETDNSSSSIDTNESDNTSILDKVIRLWNVEMIKSYINNESNFKRGESIQKTISNTQYEITNNNTLLKLYADVKGTAKDPYLVSITLKCDQQQSYGQQIIQESSCPCPVGRHGNCKHCAATLIYFMENPGLFNAINALSSSAELSTNNSIKLSLSSSSSSSSIGQKRSFEEATNEHEETSQDNDSVKLVKKIKSFSNENDDERAYDSVKYASDKNSLCCD